MYKHASYIYTSFLKPWGHTSAMRNKEATHVNTIARNLLPKILGDDIICSFRHEVEQAHENLDNV